MKSIAVLCVASVLLLKNVATQVVKMDSETFSTTVDKNHHFIMFYAPWCGHCSRLKPTWEELATNLQSDSNRKVVVAQVDCTVETELCSTQDVTGYPTLKLFVKGSNEPTRYRGQRDLISLLSFINENLGLQQDSENEILNDAKVDKPAAATGATELTEENFKEEIMKNDHFVKFFAPWCGHCQKLAPTWDTLATSVSQETATIAKVDCTQHRTLCNEFEVKGYPTLLWIKDGKSVEKYQGSRTLEDLKSFVERMKGNAKSDNQGAKEEKAAVVSSSVLVLTESNFETSIESGFALVKYYAPWCGHCKRLAPTWEELGAKFAGNSDIKIAKVDCTDGSNRQLCANQEVKGFPTIFLYSNGVKLEEYDGNRSLDDMFTFVNQNIKQQGKDEL